ncbi:hypothetical protein WR25_27070 [Diploscapter pachys]|uniref:EGF-like domain-containing protein n=1 Tax=Diploscapter pachys TaxID=2018661 RepID=A0A2A2KCQ2_9BILA|nr:hypothetical protein WR25_27070 [Diploscapter pachys]
MEHCYCLNGGRVNNTWPECSCQCLSLYRGKNCERMITCADMAQDCQHNATCVDVETGPFCNCTGTGFTGKFCETELFHSFNIFFNGEPQNQMIVSRNFSSYLTRNMTVCLFLMDIAADPTSSFAPFMALQDQTQTILFSSQRVDYVTDEQKIELKNWNISTRDWHSFRDQTATLELAPASDARIFHGYISLAQIFDYSLPESIIASSSSLCGLNGTDLNPFISWDKSFTKVSPANPGAKQEQPGICNNLQLLLTIASIPSATAPSCVMQNSFHLLIVLFALAKHAATTNVMGQCAAYLECRNELMEEHWKCSADARGTTDKVCGIEAVQIEMKVANYKKEMLYVGCIAREAERYFMQFRDKLKSMIEENDAECSEEKIKREQQSLEGRTCWSRMLFKTQACFRMAKCCPVASICDLELMSTSLGNTLKSLRQKTTRLVDACEHRMKWLIEHRSMEDSEKNFANQVIQAAEELKRTSLRFNLDNVNFIQFKSKRWIFRFRNYLKQDKSQFYDRNLSRCNCPRLLLFIIWVYHLLGTEDQPTQNIDAPYASSLDPTILAYAPSPPQFPPTIDRMDIVPNIVAHSENAEQALRNRQREPLPLSPDSQFDIAVPIENRKSLRNERRRLRKGPKNMKRILIVKQTRGLPIRAGWKSVESKKGRLMVGDITKAIEDEKSDDSLITLALHPIRSSINIPEPTAPPRVETPTVDSNPLEGFSEIGTIEAIGLEELDKESIEPLTTKSVTKYSTHRKPKKRITITLPAMAKFSTPAQTSTTELPLATVSLTTTQPTTMTTSSQTEMTAAQMTTPIQLSTYEVKPISEPPQPTFIPPVIIVPPKVVDRNIILPNGTKVEDNENIEVTNRQMELEYLSCIERSNNKTMEENDEVCWGAENKDRNDLERDIKDNEGCVQQLVRKRKHCQKLALCCASSHRCRQLIDNSMLAMQLNEMKRQLIYAAAGCQMLISTSPR